MRFLSLLLLPVAFGSLGLQACSSDDAADSGPVDCKTTAGVTKKVFAPKCGSSDCHSAKDAPDLVSPGVESRVRGVFSGTCPGNALVTPGKPETSYLYRKLTETKPSCGSQMPIGPKLSADEIACVREWITAFDAPSGSDAGGGG